MKELDKNVINYKNNIDYYNYKIDSNRKFIDFLLKENRIYRKSLEFYTKKLEEIYYSEEEIEVLNE